MRLVRDRAEDIGEQAVFAALAHFDQARVGERYDIRSLQLFRQQRVRRHRRVLDLAPQGQER